MPLGRVVAVLTLAGISAITAWACDSDDRKDQNYGTDVGSVFVPPPDAERNTQPRRDTGTTDPGNDAGADAANADAGDAADAADAAADADTRT